MAADPNRRDYSVAASQTAQENFEKIASQLEALIDERDRQVKSAYADYVAEGVADQYVAVEARWTKVATEVRTIIGQLRASMARNDESALAAIQKAKAAVDAIG
jgi:hypothetical protein